MKKSARKDKEVKRMDLGMELLRTEQDKRQADLTVIITAAPAPQPYTGWRIFSTF
jgi:hypothetical protein